MSFFDKIKWKKNKDVKLDELEELTEIDELNDILWNDIEEIKLEENLEDSLSEIEKKEFKKLEEEKKEEENIEKESKIEAKKQKWKEKVSNFKYFSPKTLLIASNIFLLASLYFSYSILTDSVFPKMKKIEIYKMDEKKISEDLKILNQNLELLENEKDQALEYRRLNYLLEQAVPLGNKYEDNIQVITNILKDSISQYDKKEKFMSKLSLKPNSKLNDINVIELNDWQQLLWINYTISIEWFQKYQHIKDFTDIISDRLKIFHIKDLWISKNINPKTSQQEYKLSINMYSYYRMPLLDEFWEPIVEEELEGTFN